MPNLFNRRALHAILREMFELRLMFAMLIGVLLLSSWKEAILLVIVLFGLSSSSCFAIFEQLEPPNIFKLNIL